MKYILLLFFAISGTSFAQEEININLPRTIQVKKDNDEVISYIVSRELQTIDVYSKNHFGIYFNIKNPYWGELVEESANSSCGGYLGQLVEDFSFTSIEKDINGNAKNYRYTLKKSSQTEGRSVEIFGRCAFKFRPTLITEALIIYVRTGEGYIKQVIE